MCLFCTLFCVFICFLFVVSCSAFFVNLVEKVCLFHFLVYIMQYILKLYFVTHNLVKEAISARAFTFQNTCLTTPFGYLIVIVRLVKDTLVKILYIHEPFVSKKILAECHVIAFCCPKTKQRDQ